MIWESGTQVEKLSTTLVFAPVPTMSRNAPNSTIIHLIEELTLPKLFITSLENTWKIIL